MKKLIPCAAVFLLLISKGFCQQHAQDGYLSLTLGPAFAIGNYSGKTLNSSNASGFAKTGQAANITYDHLLGHYFGLTAILRGQRNPLDTRALEAKFSEAKFYQAIWFGQSPTQPPPAIPYSTYPNWKFDKKAWLSASLLIGGYGEFEIKKASPLAIIVRLTAGAIYARSPELNGQSITDTATAHITQSRGSAFGLSYITAAGLKYKIAKGVCLLATAEYFETSTLKFKDVVVTTTTTHGTPGLPNYSVAQSRSTGTAQQKISSINITAGIGIQL